MIDTFNFLGIDCMNANMKLPLPLILSALSFSISLCHLSSNVLLSFKFTRKEIVILCIFLTL